MREVYSITKMTSFSDTLVNMNKNTDNVSRNVRANERAGEVLLFGLNKLKIRETSKTEEKQATGYILGVGNNTLGTTELGSATYGTVDEHTNEYELCVNGKHRIAELIEDGTKDKPTYTLLGDSDTAYLPSQSDLQGNKLTSDSVSFSSSTINLLDGLMCYWDFNGNIYDHHSTYDLTNTNATLTTDKNGDSNKAYDFNGTTAYMSITSEAFKTPEATWSIWLNQGDGGKYVMSYGSGSSSRFLVRTYDTSGILRFYDDILNEGQWVNLATNIFDDNEWHHLVVVFQSSGTKEGYIDGAYVGSDTDGANLSSVTGTGVLRISGKPAGGDYFKGKIDEVAIWDKALTSDEVSALYNNGNYLTYGKLKDVSRFRLEYEAEFNASVNVGTVKEYGIFKGDHNDASNVMFMRRPIPSFTKDTNNFLKITSYWDFMNG